MSARHLARIAGLAAAYFVTGKLGLELAFVNDSATAVWPPSGIALAALLLWGARLWPGVWIGAFLVNITTSGSLPATLGIATGNTLEPVLGALLVRRYANGKAAFEHAGDCLRFMALAALASTTVSATCGAASLALVDAGARAHFGAVWSTWWLGDLVSVAVLTPLLLVWSSPDGEPRRGAARGTEAAVLLAALAAAGLLVFGPASVATSARAPLSFVVFPLLLWAACRFGQRGAIGAVFVLAVAAIWGTLRGVGPFASPDTNTSLLLLQAFLATITVTNLVLGAAVSERARSARALVASEQRERARAAELGAAHRRLATSLAVARVLAQSHAGDDTLVEVLRTVVTTMGWRAGTLWRVDASAARLRREAVWHDRSVDGERFLELTVDSTFAKGDGLPGRVWAAREPAWIDDVHADPDFPRAAAAAAAGIRAAFAFPIVAGDELLAVLELFSGEPQPPDHALMAMLGGIGGQIGQFLDARGVEHARRLAEAAVQRSQRQLQLVTDSMAVQVAHCTRDLRYAWVSRSYAERLGKAADELVGRSLEEVHGRDAFDRLRPRVERVLAGETVQYEEHLPVASGSPRRVNVVHSPTFAADGTVDGWVAAVTDIDGRFRAEEALRDADRRKDEFLAILAHELRNPLAPVRTAVELLRGLAPAVPAIVPLRDVIERQVTQMARLLDDLLDVSRITSGRLRLRRERTALAAVLHVALETSRPAFDAQQHRLVVTLPDEPIDVDGDPTRLAQVFANLLNNAAKYTPAGGRVELALERSGEHAIVRLRDDGVGIAADELARIFELFVQGEQSADRLGGGLGVGLTLARRLVEMHGGTIEAASRGRGHGSEFLVRLPLLPAVATDAAGAAAVPLPADAPPRPLRVLVADDNEDAATLLAHCLRLRGHETVTAHDGHSAVQAAATFRPDVALLDIGMPGLTGYDVARRIRASPGGRQVLLVALTGWGQDADKQRAADAGFDQHLTKPAEVEAVLALLRRAGERP